MSVPKIIYTITDEAPALATYSFLPIIKIFSKSANISIETRDISLSGRILANFPENLDEDQKRHDDLKELGKLTKKPEANIIKLPNISASIPQLNAAINELQSKGYDIPNYSNEPKNSQERDIKDRYSKVLGSAVNPILREGNSDRRVAKAVKEYAKLNPHDMGEWDPESKTSVAHMEDKDFYSSECSINIQDPGYLKIEFIGKDQKTLTLKEKISVQKNEVIDAAVMNCDALQKFYSENINKAKSLDTLLSLHLKSTMMKVSDPIMFGHAVKIFFEEVFKKYELLFKELGVNANNGINDIYKKIAHLPKEERRSIEKDIELVYSMRPELAMVDSEKGITNLHVPSDIIIDASMPAAIRSSGKMWNKNGTLQDTTAMIPDRCYAGIFDEVIKFCKKNGAFDVSTMGNVSNVGLMAKKAEEYGSHDKTFEIPCDGVMRVLNASGTTLFEHAVKSEDIWRMCQTKDIAIENWVKLAVKRAQSTKLKTIFWLDEKRAHDKIVIKKVEHYLSNHDIKELDIKIMSPITAMKQTLESIKKGVDIISVTGNVLRDYLTDLFPILELGTSAKMLSIVPLLSGGGLYETGAGGSAPKHIQQFLKEGHLRWDSLGEFLALAVSIKDISEKTNNKKAVIITKSLDLAISRVLKNKKSPTRKVGELDSRGSHFYLAMYWAEELADQSLDNELKNKFAKLHHELKNNEEKIINEINITQGKAINIGGYYHPDPELTTKSMCPSQTLNQIISAFS